MYQKNTTHRGTTQTLIFSKKGSSQSDSFVKYEHAKNPDNTTKGLGKYNGTHLALWALGASKFGHIDEARKQAQRIKEGNY